MPSVLTEIPWQPDKSIEILNTVQEFQAFRQVGRKPPGGQSEGFQGPGQGERKGSEPKKFDWPTAADSFLESMEGRRGGTLADLKIRVQHLKLTLNNKPAQTDGPFLMRANARMFSMRFTRPITKQDN